jgi:exopolyphosphatase/guanosine-5'-triphosphate,3'-diphosphate pyrophosphatase
MTTSRTRRVGAIDVGTNSVLLLIAEGTPEAPRAVLERATITRLGEGVDRSGRLSPEAMRRTALCLAGYAALLRDHEVGSVDVVCTSAARDAENGGAFLDLATHALGAAPRIIAGDEEARLTFDGALTGLSAAGDVTVFDVGGGSTEIIRGTIRGPAAEVHTAVSLDVGSVRLTERHVRSDPPSPAEIGAVRADVEHALGTVPQSPTTDLVGVAGTVTTLAAIDQELSTYDPARVHGATLSRAAIEGILGRLAALPVAARQRVPGLDPGRADVIVAGTVLVLSVLDWAGVGRLRVSDRGVRWGLASAALRRAP